MNDGLPRDDPWPISSTGEWLERRRRDITASRIGALWDSHPYLSRDGLAAELRGERSEVPNAAMRAGIILEPAVAAAVALEHPSWTIEKAGTYHRLSTVRLGCTPDYFYSNDTVRRGILQCKTVSPQQWDNWHGTVPLAYTLQTLTEMLVTDADAGLLAVLIRGGSYPLYEFEVPRHAEAEHKIIEATTAWWAAYEAGELPQAQPVEDIEALIDDGSHLDWSGNEEVRALLEQRRSLKAESSVLQQRLGAVEYAIKNRIGPASTAWLPGWQITFRRHHRKEYTVQAADVRMLKIKEIPLE